MVYAEDPFPLWVDPASNLFVTNDVRVLERLVDTLNMEMFTSEKNCILFGNGYVQHAGATNCDFRKMYRDMGDLEIFFSVTLSKTRYLALIHSKIRTLPDYIEIAYCPSIEPYLKKYGQMAPSRGNPYYRTGEA